jgi:hypothetical protein
MLFHEGLQSRRSEYDKKIIGKDFLAMAEMKFHHTDTSAITICKGPKPRKPPDTSQCRVRTASYYGMVWRGTYLGTKGLMDRADHSQAC